MDERVFLDLAVVAAALGGWFLCYALARLATRPASPPPAPATMELGPEPPAVVSLLVNRWAVDEDAAESTLLDLAARRFVELRQPGSDPLRTTVHLPATPADTGALRPYERRVLDRVRGLAVHGVVPLTALTFRDQGQATAWNKRLRAEVIADARAAGLSRRRFDRTVTGLLIAAAAGAAGAVSLAAFHYGSWSNTEDNPGYWAGFVTFAVLSTFTGRSPGERDTPLGRQVASRWLGVRDWLRGHPEFAELPPASVAVWDRYLGYGAALGTTHLASAVLDLGLGDRKLVWSSYGGTWHRVRVRYPRFWPRYGRTTPILLLRAVISIAVGAFLLKLASGPYALLPGVVLGPALLALIFGLYTLVRSLADLATERAITGEVLWQDVWQSTAAKENRPARPWLHYLAVDDGTGDHTTAWGLPSEWADRCHDGDLVTIKVRPWSRRVVDLSVGGHGRSRRLVESVSADDTGDLAAALRGEHAGPGPAEAPPVELFTVGEVAQALGLPVRAAVAGAAAGPLATAQFVSADGGTAVLMVHTASGTPGRWAWQAQSRGTPLPGIGDGARTSGDRAAVRVGDLTIVVTLLGDARGRAAHLPWLLAQCAGRLATRRERTLS
jgi:hypothetical protein